MVERFHRTVRNRFSALDPANPFLRRLHQVLLSIRSSVHRMLGVTPAEAFFGRSIRTRIPGQVNSSVIALPHQLQQKVRMAESHDQRRGVKNLPQLAPGTVVVLQDGHTPSQKQWTVVKQRGRSVIVSDGVRTAFRNRQQVRTFHAPVVAVDADSSLTPQPPSPPVVSCPPPHVPDPVITPPDLVLEPPLVSSPPRPVTPPATDWECSPVPASPVLPPAQSDPVAVPTSSEPASVPSPTPSTPQLRRSQCSLKKPHQSFRRLCAHWLVSSVFDFRTVFF